MLAACWLCAVRALCKRGRLAPVTIGCAVGSLLALALTLLLRAYYLGSAAFAEDMPALQGSLEVAVNTDMSVGLAILVFFLLPRECRLHLPHFLSQFLIFDL